MGVKSSKSSVPIHDSEIIVHGYLHELQQEMKLLNIPPLIMSTCLVFYKDEDFFVPTDLGYYAFEDNNKTTKKLFGKEFTIWQPRVKSNVSIDFKIPLIATWTIKINQCSISRRNCPRMAVGLQFEKLDLYIENDGGVHGKTG